ncbi:MAG TPA: hypothetical protein VLW85_26320 [Myxococcales bacterium]|nr:hypothetical protein [Myxococcales bacterium]
MDPFIQSVSQTVAQDVRGLMHATQLEEPQLEERPPPNWHWGIPLGFASIAAAGTLLIAAGGVQQQVRDQQHHARHHQTQMHKHRHNLQPRPAN